MGLSETIVAAMIGAGATVGTALFQLLTAFKSKTDAKPKRGTTVRSLLAVAVLMAASAAGGFLYSQLLQQRAGEDIRAMRQELRELRDLTAARVMDERDAEVADAAVSAPVVQAPMTPVPAASPVTLEPASGVAESIAYVPACRAAASESTECKEVDAQRIALCGTIPAHAAVRDISLFAQPDAVQHAWGDHAVTLEADIGGARFSGKPFEYAQGQDVKAVCVNFMQWSSQHPYIARIVVEYGFGAAADHGQLANPVVTDTAPSSGDVLQVIAPAVSAFGASTTALR